ncbi:tetratricopeptide repeat protein [Limibacillus sp. MBR-115]|uniref:tetratricopeptide repeat protein n=1 Tax=Limibacillus sp. MBR-115 TaxID=3156465 RepID=UPI003391041D
MSDIFEEVEEAVRHEQYMKLWKRYRFVVIGAAVALVLGVAGYQGWTYWKQQQSIKNSERFAAALAIVDEQGTAEAVAALEEVAKENPSGYGVLARFRIAGEHQKAGDKAAAVGALDALSNDTAVPKALRDLARLQSVMLELDDAAPDALEGRLAPLLNEANPFYASATELMGYIAMKKGDDEKARTLFQTLVDGTEAPGGVRSRAQRMLTVLGAE